MHNHHIDGMVQWLKPVLKDPLKAKAILQTLLALTDSFGLVGGRRAPGSQRT
jgi:hypothetical protein